MRAPGYLFVFIALLMGGCSSNLQPWHTERLSEEFSRNDIGKDINSFSDYLEMEERLFAELDENIKAQTAPAQLLNRYSPGSPANPQSYEFNWNRSFELVPDKPLGGVLLLHGMSDSPYSLRALGQRLYRQGYHVIGLRLPGHGTAPSGLRNISWKDMAAATQLAMEHLDREVPNAPLHLVGYSTGATLALNATLEAIESEDPLVPDSLILISPAIRVHSSAALAGFKNGLSYLPGLDGLAYLNVMDEFDPYKYNSFATNAGNQVHKATREVDRQLERLTASGKADQLMPPILVFKSTVDATVTTRAVVDDLLYRLPGEQHELVLFDINQHSAVKSFLLVDDPAPFTRRLMATENLPFTFTLVTNSSPDSLEVIARRKIPGTNGDVSVPLNQSWPIGVVSLSHVAVPFPSDDPIYGMQYPEEHKHIYLGSMAIMGERGLLKIPSDMLIRLRANPFYDYLEDRVMLWVDTHP